MLVWIAVQSPAESVWMPKCPVWVLTGYQCPGCGFTRALHALMHGHLGEALSYNYFFIISIPYLLAVMAVLWVPALNRRTRLRSFVAGPVPAWFYAITFCIWWVVRNILGI